MLIAARLPLSFDVGLLEAAVQAVEGDGWAPHFNTQYYAGDWSGIPFRSNSVTGPLYTDPSRLDQFKDLPALDRAPYIRQVVATFQAPVRSVRFLKLAPGAVIREHRDFGLRLEDGEIRIHIPVRTNPDVEFILGGKTLNLLPGEPWYLNLDLPHQLANRGSSERVHLVLDFAVCPWIEELLARPECSLET